MSQEFLIAKWEDICKACASEGGDPRVAWIAFVHNYGYTSWAALTYIEDLINRRMYATRR